MACLDAQTPMFRAGVKHAALDSTSSVGLLTPVFHEAPDSRR
jgi:hypothetical protein